jgi:hypothetical protein
VLTNWDSLQNFEATLKTLRIVEIWLTLTLALAVGARLNDAGLNRWMGIGATLLITRILPSTLRSGYLAASPKPSAEEKPAPPVAAAIR